MVLADKPEGKRTLRKPRVRWEDNIHIDLRQVGRDMERINVTQNTNRWWAVVNAVMKHGDIFDV
jgi:hypothetical protein